MILHWIVIITKKIWSFGHCWPLLAFIGLFSLCVLGWFFKAKTGLCWWKLSTINLFPTINCQNQSPNEIGHFESVWKCLCFKHTARPQNMQPLGSRTLQICSFELGPKTLEICGFWPKTLQISNFFCWYLLNLQDLLWF